MELEPDSGCSSCFSLHSSNGFPSGLRAYPNNEVWTAKAPFLNVQGVYFYSLTMSHYFVLAMEICNLDFGNDTHLNNQIDTIEGHLFTPTSLLK